MRKRKRGGLIIQSRDYAVVQRRCCLCYSSCRQSTSAALNTLLSAVRFQVWQTLSKSYRYNPTIYETTIKRRIEWYNQINEIPIIKRKFFLSKIFCLEKIYFRFIFKSIFKADLMKNVSKKIILIESSLPKLSFKLNLVQKLPLQAELLNKTCKKNTIFSPFLAKNTLFSWTFSSIV